MSNTNKEKKRKILRIVWLLMVVFCIIGFIYTKCEKVETIKECKVLYEKKHLTEEDLKTKPTFKFSTSTKSEETGEVEVKYKKLYGIDYIEKFKIDKDGGIKIESSNDAPAKYLILDETGNERFYREASKLFFEPGETGNYDVYIIGNKFSGKVTFTIY